ncbi:acyltransferase [Microlunatus capsulatus]|uniref:Maltose O-acetyltransferase n=1 Tax=Microlunatus capsulatus TaxID=99117 RepID=A0ABS4ZBX5_9ACTN|nr:acyltransferase [Microlunatus capsulatus]MBP2418563.1 maltose O-acetyltransferase [Microlunatus capsulatus]
MRDALVNTWGASVLTPRHLRWALLKAYGVRLERASVGARCWFGSRDVTIGRSAYVNRGVFFDGIGPIRVGKRVHLGMEVMILTGSHSIGGPDCRAGALSAAPVVIEDGAWIGARAVLMPGAVVGRGSVVAAGSVVTGTCDPDTLYAGVPARKIRVLGPEDRETGP